MKEVLLKKRYRIPAALLLAILISAGVAAAYLMGTLNISVEITEPITIENATEFTGGMQPGDENTWTLTVANSSERNSYNILYHVTNGLADEDRISVTTFTINAGDKLGDLQGDDNIVGVGDNVTYTVNTETTDNIIIVITAENDAPPQDVVFKMKISRQ